MYMYMYRIKVCTYMYMHCACMYMCIIVCLGHTDTPSVRLISMNKGYTVYAQLEARLQL